MSGYTGGTLANPTYEQVSLGGTGHREAVRITTDPNPIIAAVKRGHQTLDSIH